MKKLFDKFLKKLEKANKENFGNGKLDCCDLNKKGNNANKQNKEYVELEGKDYKVIENK